MANGDLWAIGTETLDAVGEAFDDAGVALPGRQFVAAGLPPDDCGQVVVWLGRLFTGLPAAEVAEAEHLGVPRSLELSVRITRCVPVVSENGDPPAADAIQAASQEIATDMWVLVQGLLRLRTEGTFLTQCQNLVMGNCEPFEWLGGIGGCELLLRIQVHGA